MLYASTYMRQLEYTNSSRIEVTDVKREKKGVRVIV